MILVIGVSKRVSIINNKVELSITNQIPAVAHPKLYRGPIFYWGHTIVKIDVLSHSIADIHK